MRYGLAVAVVASLAVGGVHAQVPDATARWGQRQLLRDMLPHGPGEAARPPTSGPAPAGTVPFPGVTTAYSVSPELTRRVRAQFIDFVRQSSGPGVAEQVQDAFGREDPLPVWVRNAYEGLRLGDLADAMAAYWVQNWQLVNFVSDASSPQVRAVRDQIRRTLRADPAFALLDDAQKQEMAEVYIYSQLAQAALLGGVMRGGSSSSDKESLELVGRLHDAAVARFRNEMHVDPLRLKLTDAGFVPN